MPDTTPPATSKKKSSVPAVEKALDVLELLSLHRDGMTMNELVAELDRTMGELYRVVLYLAERDYVRQDPATSRYALTPRLFELAHRHPPTERLLREAVPVLERIAALTDQSCHLGTLNRANILILASVASPRPAGYAVRTGAMFPATATSSGMVILAFSPPDAQKRFLARLPKEERAPAQERLARIAEHGYDDSPSQIVAGVRNLSAPVFDNRGVVCAITCGFIAQSEQKLRPDETLDVIRQNATQLSHALGAPTG
ncbi:IclR family transcriptional regulator [Halovulum sp. GXIMD14794]